MSEKIRHVAIIMDGNGRWAECRKLPRMEGHRQGARQISEMIQAAKDHGIDYLTLYAFSTENWKRSPAEVSGLMGLLEEFLDEKVPELMEQNVRLRTIGRIEDLPAAARRKLKKALEQTAGNTAGPLVIALSYGGRAEIIDAINQYGREVAKSGKAKKLTEESFRNYLYAPDIPDPDLLIRTSGEMRLSNFLLWQLSYSEIYVTDTLWPDFGKEAFAEALENFKGRQRRFGGRK